MTKDGAAGVGRVIAHSVFSNVLLGFLCYTGYLLNLIRRIREELLDLIRRRSHVLRTFRGRCEKFESRLPRPTILLTSSFEHHIKGLSACGCDIYGVN